MRNTNPTKIQEPQHSKLKQRGTRTPPKYKNHNTDDEEHEPHQNTRTTTQQTKTTRNTNPTKIQEPQHSKLKQRGTRAPPKYKNHNTAN